ncbi:MAG: thioredoxin [Planctomycetia bacterium]|nr:thioredoxin [Planctomycetia bacterium]
MSEDIQTIHSIEEFDQCIEKGITLVDFWASWCGPCRMQLPIIDALAKEWGGKVKIVKVNVDENQDLAVRFNVESIPALFLFKDGKVVQHYVGVQSAAVLSGALETAIA